MQKHIVNCMIAGIVAILPIFGFFLFVGYMENEIASTGIGSMKFYFPGMGLIACLIIVYLLGLLVTTFIGKWLWSKLDVFINNIPVFGQVYEAIKEILGYNTANNTVFQRVVMLPSSGDIGEEFGLVTKTFKSGTKNKLVVFVPFGPTPTSGRLIIVDDDKVKPLDTNASEVFSSLISMGKNHKLEEIYLNKKIPDGISE